MVLLLTTEQSWMYCFYEGVAWRMGQVTHYLGMTVILQVRITGRITIRITAAAEVVKAISAPLSACIKGFPVPDSLHPFEAALLDLTIGMESYQRRLNRVADMRRACVEVHPALASSIASPSAVADSTPSP